MLYSKKGEINMPNHILFEDIIDDMLDNISYIKLNTYVNLGKKDQ